MYPVSATASDIVILVLAIVVFVARLVRSKRTLAALVIVTVLVA